MTQRTALSSGLLMLVLVLALPLRAGAQQAPNTPAPAAATAAGNEVTLNLRDVDIRTLIDTVSKATGINFVVDPRVRGNVTVVSSSPMDRDALYQVFLSVLDVYGYSAVPAGAVVKIVPAINARQSLQLHGQGEEMVTRVIRVQDVGATQLATMLRPLLPPQALLAAYPPGNMLIVTDRADNVARVMRLVAQLDRPGEAGISVIQLQHASAEDVARTINELQEPPAGAESALPQARVVADRRTNSLLLAGDSAAQARVRALIGRLDVPLPQAGNSRVVFLRYAKAGDIAKVLGEIVSHQQSAGGKSRSVAESPVNIQADSASNALILTGPPDKLRDLREIVRQLDIRPKEVLIDAIIADVSGDLSRQLGAQIAVLPNRGSSQGPAALTNFSNGALPLTTLAAGSVATAGALAGQPGLLLGFGSNRAGQTRYGLLLNALSSNSATNILSTPSLLTLDNKEAEIVVGQNVPFLTGSYSTTQTPTGGGVVSSPFQTIERKDIGITLKVTPQINLGDSVRLKLELTVSSLAPSVTGATDLITNKRQIKTVVITDSDSIIVLGGLIQDTYRDSVQKVPLLGSLPLIGHLFRSTSRERQKQNLMIFLHPVILSNQTLANAYTAEKYRVLRQQQNAPIQGSQSDAPTPMPSLPENLQHFAPAPPGLPPARSAPAPAIGGASSPARAGTASAPTVSDTPASATSAAPPHGSR